MNIDEEYGQFTFIDIQHEIFKLKDEKKHTNRFIKREPRIAYYDFSDHDYLFNPDYYYYSDEEICNEEKPKTNNRVKNKTNVGLFEFEKHWFIYLGILFTSAYSIYFIFTL